MDRNPSSLLDNQQKKRFYSGAAPVVFAELQIRVEVA